jgi:mevalonate kinase
LKLGGSYTIDRSNVIPRRKTFDDSAELGGRGLERKESGLASRGSGFGKTILIGDMFVSLGVPAIVSAIPQQTVASVKRTNGNGWSLKDNRPEISGYKTSKRAQQEESIGIILRSMGIDTDKQRLSIELDGNLIAGSGIGASAAGCVALVRALDDEFALGLTIEQVNHMAWKGEFAYHGKPSGIDNTASCFGGIMVFQQTPESGKTSVTKINLKQPIEAVLVNSGVTVNTATKREYIARYAERYPSKYRIYLKTTTQQSMDMAKALQQFDLEQVGCLMDENHNILIDMGLSHDIVIHLGQLAKEQGALGAKVTGGGRGGYMVALTPGEVLQQKVATAFEEEGFQTLSIKIGLV